jgi:hypothetical protein
MNNIGNYHVSGPQHDATANGHSLSAFATGKKDLHRLAAQAHHAAAGYRQNMLDRTRHGSARNKILKQAVAHHKHMSTLHTDIMTYKA